MSRHTATATVIISSVRALQFAYATLSGLRRLQSATMSPANTLWDQNETVNTVVEILAGLRWYVIRVFFLGVHRTAQSSPFFFGRSSLALPPPPHPFFHLPRSTSPWFFFGANGDVRSWNLLRPDDRVQINIVCALTNRCVSECVIVDTPHYMWSGNPSIVRKASGRLHLTKSLRNFAMNPLWR